MYLMRLGALCWPVLYRYSSAIRTGTVQSAGRCNISTTRLRREQPRGPQNNLVLVLVGLTCTRLETNLKAVLPQQKCTARVVDRQHRDTRSWSASPVAATRRPVAHSRAQTSGLNQAGTLNHILLYRIRTYMYQLRYSPGRSQLCPARCKSQLAVLFVRSTAPPHGRGGRPLQSTAKHHSRM